MTVAVQPEHADPEALARYLHRAVADAAPRLAAVVLVDHDQGARIVAWCVVHAHRIDVIGVDGTAGTSADTAHARAVDPVDALDLVADVAPEAAGRRDRLRVVWTRPRAEDVPAPVADDEVIPLGLGEHWRLDRPLGPQLRLVGHGHPLAKVAAAVLARRYAHGASVYALAEQHRMPWHAVDTLVSAAWPALLRLDRGRQLGPQMAGYPIWHRVRVAIDVELACRYAAGQDVDELAEEHQLTPATVQAALLRVGQVDLDHDRPLGPQLRAADPDTLRRHQVEVDVELARRFTAGADPVDLARWQQLTLQSVLDSLMRAGVMRDPRQVPPPRRARRDLSPAEIDAVR